MELHEAYLHINVNCMRILERNIVTIKIEEKITGGAQILKNDPRIKLWNVNSLNIPKFVLLPSLVCEYSNKLCRISS